MFSYQARLEQAFASAPVLSVDDHSRIVLMSDCHRGNGTMADDFAKNQSICHAALSFYHRLGYTYIELGDGDELWENRSIDEIKAIHGDIFRELAEFYRDGRLWMLYGNHDMEKKHKQKLLDSYRDAITRKVHPLCPGSTVYESLLLRYEPVRKDIFLLHGHQVDFLNDTLWKLARFLVRYVWRTLELIGVNDPTSAARNNKVKSKIERRLTQWSQEKGMPVIAGHTHRPVFPEPGEGRYFNDGSCVHPWNITAIEITSGTISLVKWGQKTREDGVVTIGRDVIAGPRPLRDYL